MDELLTILLAGLALNLCDVAVTLLFAARAWTDELRKHRIVPNPLTPPFYIGVNFVGAALLYMAVTTLSAQMGAGVATGLVASAFVWAVSRLYGLGHVVMRQMPLRIFAIMSAGLGLGYLAAGQVILWSIR